MDVRRQMLHPEGHSLMNERIFDHLIIIQKQQQGSGWLSQFIEEYGQSSRKRGRLWRVQHGQSVRPDAWHAGAQRCDHPSPEAERIIVQPIQRQPGNLRLVLARPGGEQRGFAPTGRGGEQRQRGGKRPIERREQALPLHQ